MICNIHAYDQPRYAHYAAVCAHSAMKNGGLRPEQIYVTACDVNRNEPAVVMLEKMGCKIFQTHHKTKLAKIDHLFRSVEPDSVLYLDSDTIVQPGTVLEFDDPFLVHGFDYPFPKMMENRKDWSPPPLFFLEHFGIDLDDFSEKKWIWGSFLYIEKSIIGTKFWDMATLGNEYLMPSDEISMLLADRVDPTVKIFDKFPQVYVTEDLREHLGSENCLLHYAGHHPKRLNEKLITEMYGKINSKMIPMI